MDPELTDEQFTAELGAAVELAVPPPALVLHAAALRRGTQLRRRRTARNILAGTALTAVVAGAVVYGATAGGPRTVTVSAAAAPAQPSASASAVGSSAPASPSASATPLPADGGTPQPLAQEAADIAATLLPPGTAAHLAGVATSIPALTTGTTGVEAAFKVTTPQGQHRLVVNVSRLATPAHCQASNSGGQTCSTRPLDGGTLVVFTEPGSVQASKVPVVSYTWNGPGGLVLSAQEWNDNGSAANWLTTAQVDALLTSSKWQPVISQLPAPAAGSNDSGTYCTSSC